MDNPLNSRKCEPCEGIGTALARTQIQQLMPQLNCNWQLNNDATCIERHFKFDNFYCTMAFVNALAWITHTQNHHPDLKVGYNYCDINLNTHALAGLSHNDFIVAAQIDKLLS